MRRAVTLLFAVATLATMSAAERTAWTGEKPTLTWASKDVQYRRNELPDVRLTADTAVAAWRGERVGVQALFFSPSDVSGLTVALGPWIDENGCEAVPASAGSAAWMRYVITDDNNGCGDHAPLPTFEVADIIDLPGSEADIEAMSARPVWCTLEVPRNLAPGSYTSRLSLCKGEETIDSLTLTINVCNNTLPEVADQKFYLDFWQQPYSVSRYYGLERWSDAHFEALRPYMQALARAGQKVVTTILFYEPWGRQSYDKFDPMVETTLRTDGTWAFDFALFDRWVEFMDTCGINARINCYSMIPWDMSFRYFDESNGTYACLDTQTNTDEYAALWTAFLTDFSAHLREKGWFDKTAIAMDERGLGAMLDAVAIVNNAAPGLKIALAGNYHAELSPSLYDYSITYSRRFPADELARRKEAGQISTSYVCCADPGANIFTNKAPSDAAYLPVQAIAAGLDGILHWSWLNWTDKPLLDSRLQLVGNDAYTFAPGDTYSYYPGPRSSVRFERLIEGIQQTEKIRILREQRAASGNDGKCERLDALLELFATGKTDAANTTATMVNDLEALLNDCGK